MTHQTYNTDMVQVMNNDSYYMRVLEEDTDRRIMPGNPATIVQGSSSLPDFVSGGQGGSHGEGRVINAGLSSAQSKPGSKVPNGTVISGKKPTTTVAPISALSKRKWNISLINHHFKHT